MIIRREKLKAVLRAMARAPVVALLGPRQCGKTTLAKSVMSRWRKGEVAFFDLESPADRTRLQNPELALGALRGLVVLDEAQAMPALFNVLRVLADRSPMPARFLILGSASPQIVRGVSETLAGRAEFVDLGGFTLDETGSDREARLWVRGGFPRSYLAGSEAASLAWRTNFIRTFLNADLPALGIRVPAVAMRRFWTMLAHYHGQTWNGSELGRAMGLSDKTVREYLDILTGAYMIRQLQPWHENVGKRQVKAPKIYLRDSGLLHTLLDLGTAHALSGHPKVGASWEGFVIEQIMAVLPPAEPYFWGTHSGAELDVLFHWNGRRYGVEIKRTETPALTRSMISAIETLKLAHLWIVYPGAHAIPLRDDVQALPLNLALGTIQGTIRKTGSQSTEGE